MEFAYRTDIGRRRPNNQDYVGIFKNQSEATLALVADGMGGHRGGDVASERAVSHLGYAFEKTDTAEIESIVRWLIFELQQENDMILQKAKQYTDLSGMGTTVVAVIISGTRFVVANIGDSRGYLYRNGHLVQITEDHSLVNELVKHGELTPEEAKRFPQRNVITRSLGVSSDNEAIAAVLRQDMPIGSKAQELILRANAAGGPDNITALIIHQDRREPS